MTPAWLDPRTAYVHVPFCAHHCGYCDFAVTAGHDHLIGHYLDALALELATLGASHPVETLFIGGGTPTHLNPAQLERLLDEIARWLPFQQTRWLPFQQTGDRRQETESEKAEDSVSLLSPASCLLSPELALGPEFSIE